MPRRNSTDPGLLTRRQLLGAGAAAAASWAAGCGGSPPSTRQLPSDVVDFHREIPVLDLHIDTPLWMRLLGYDLAARHRNPLPGAAYFSHLDLPRAAEGGLDGCVMGLVISPDRVESELILPLRVLARIERSSGIEQTLATLDLLGEAEQRHPQRLRFARSGSQMREAIAAGRFAALAGLEGAHGIGDRLENVRTAHERGLRMLGLVHFQRSAAAWPMTVTQFADRGLTPFGFDLIAELESLRMVVDLAHLNSRGLDETLGVMTRPFVVSHTACRGIHDNPRNLDDGQLRRIADAGGVIGIAAGRDLFGATTLERFLDHVEHALRLGGSEAVALGSDWDGAIVPAEDMQDVRCLPHVTHGLLRRGWSREIVARVMGGNALRVITEVCG